MPDQPRSRGKDRGQRRQPQAGRRAFATPALDTWRAELSAGTRSPTDFDPIWKAACAEATALEFIGLGLPSVALTFREDARRIVKEAIQARKRGAA